MSKQRRKTKARPLARPGVPIISNIVSFMTINGTKKFFWYVTENLNDLAVTQSMPYAELMATQEVHGPFDTAEEADTAARIAIAGGEDCEFTDAGVWDPAWSKPQ